MDREKLERANKIDQMIRSCQDASSYIEKLLEEKIDKVEYIKIGGYTISGLNMPDFMNRELLESMYVALGDKIVELSNKFKEL